MNFDYSHRFNIFSGLSFEWVLETDNPNEVEVFIKNINNGDLVAYLFYDSISKTMYSAMGALRYTQGWIECEKAMKGDVK